MRKILAKPFLALHLLSPAIVFSCPLIFMLANNLNELDVRDFLFGFICCVVSSVGGMTLFIGVWLLFRDLFRSLILTFVIAVCFFSYGHIFELLYTYAQIVKNEKLLYWSLYFGYLVIFISALIFILRARINFPTVVIFLSVSAAVFVVKPICQIITHPLMKRVEGAAAGIVMRKAVNKTESNADKKYNATFDVNKPANVNYNNQSALARVVAEDLPDIYYFILDEYARHDVLSEFYDFDNSDMLYFLKNKGFFIAESSKSNYAFTYLSVPSSLNMTYMQQYINDTYVPGNGTANTRIKMSELTRNPIIAQKLKAIGYQYVTILSSVPGLSDKCDIADVVFQYKPLGLSYVMSEFFTVLVQTTMLRPWAPRAAKQRLYMLDMMEKIPKNIRRTPKFVFVHILMPHEPFLFTADGREYTNLRQSVHKKIQYDRCFRKKGYVEQLKYLNSRMKSIITAILDAKLPDQPAPIIILQGDHGTNYSKYLNESPHELPRERMAIFNAYHGSKEFKDVLYNEITPVNTFRVILSYLGYEMAMLPDISYYSKYVPDESNFMFDIVE